MALLLPSFDFVSATHGWVQPSGQLSPALYPDICSVALPRCGTDARLKLVVTKFTDNYNERQTLSTSGRSGSER
jgi:hypothetical protein